LRVAALSLRELKTELTENYVTGLTKLLEELQVELAVLPSYTAFLLWIGAGYLRRPCGFLQGLKLFMQEASEWNQHFLGLHSDLARENGLYLVAGTTVEEKGGLFYQTAYCFNPKGELCGKQRQTHLSREERALGFSRGEELCLVDLVGLKMGLIVGTDARHSEIGRILALEGAALVAHTGALVDGLESKTQLAGIWAQVQQNQFWAVEAQLNGTICERSFQGQCAIIGPCEVTPDLTGYLAQASDENPDAIAELVEADRQEIQRSYPLLRLLQPKAYEGLLPELYGSTPGTGIHSSDDKPNL
jgi:predicted amidohydrolase